MSQVQEQGQTLYLLKLSEFSLMQVVLWMIIQDGDWLLLIKPTMSSSQPAEKRDSN